MATITIDDDVLDALKDKRLNRADAAVLMDGRKERAKLQRQLDRLEEKAAPLRLLIEGLDAELSPLELAVNADPAPEELDPVAGSEAE